MVNPEDDRPSPTFVTVLAFGGVADVVGKPQFELELLEEASVAEVLGRVVAHYPVLATRRALLRVAVNGVYAADEERVHPGDEIALIPPVAGG